MQFLISVLPSCGVGKAQHLRNHRTQIEQMLSSRQDRRRPFLFFFWVVVAIKSRVETGPFIMWCSSENVSSVGWSLCFYLKERRRGVGGVEGQDKDNEKNHHSIGVLVIIDFFQPLTGMYVFVHAHCVWPWHRLLGRHMAMPDRSQWETTLSLCLGVKKK